MIALELNPIEWILFISSFVAFIPMIPLIRLYIRTRIGEYLLFCGVFLSSSIFAISSIIAQETGILLFWQLMFSARNFTYFLFFLHLTRMLWYTPPGYILHTGSIGYAIVQFSILLWRFNEDGVPGLYLPDGTAIFSPENRLLGLLFQFYVVSLFLYAYYKIQIENPSNRVKNTKLLMLLLSSALVMSRAYRIAQVFGLPMNQGTEIFGHLLIVIGFFAVGLVYIIYPESIMLTIVQLGGVLVLSRTGVPVAANKFKESNIRVPTMLLGGIMTAVETILTETMETEDQTSFHQLLTRKTSVLIYRGPKFMYSIITKDNPTSLQRSSLKFFARNFVRLYKTEILQFERSGRMIMDISKVLELAFPYSSGLTPEPWR